MKLKILIIEDDANTSSLLKTFLISKGFHADTAVDGVEGLEKISKAAPHLILLDVMLPRLDGYGVLTELKKDPKLAKIPIIILTASEMTRDLFLQLGVKDFVTKPYDPEALYRLISKHLK